MPDSAILFLPLLSPFLRRKELTQLQIQLLRSTGDFHTPKKQLSINGQGSVRVGVRAAVTWHDVSVGELSGGEKLLTTLPQDLRSSAVFL